jgi:hypothetical protein
MCDIGSEIWSVTPASAHNLAKFEGPPPLAVARMLGSRRRRRQENRTDVSKTLV